MDIQWINQKNIDRITKGKEVFVYGCGSLGKVTCKWLDRNGCRRHSFCVDREYLSEGLLPTDECFRRVNDERAICIYAIGEADAFKTFVGRNEIPIVYAVFDPFEFWIFDEADYREHLNEINEARSLLADERSRRTFDGYIRAKRECDGRLSAENADYDGKYFNELTKNLKNGAYVDCGAYIGDTIDLFRSFYGIDRRKIYAFEPDSASFGILEKKYGQDKDVHLINKGVWDSEGILRFREGYGERSEVACDGGDEIQVTSIDEAINEKVSFIKIGCGNAKRVLKGASTIVNRDMPVIAFFTLYSLRDLYELPKIIKSLENGMEHYNIFLRHNSYTTCGLLYYYAVPE